MVVVVAVGQGAWEDPKPPGLLAIASAQVVGTECRTKPGSLATTFSVPSVEPRWQESKVGLATGRGAEGKLLKGGVYVSSHSLLDPG